jgi:hypothetical protein
MAEVHEMAAKTYRVRVVQDGREFEAEGDRAFVLEMLKQYGPELAIDPKQKQGGGKKEVKPVTRQESQLKEVSKGLSVREFIQKFELTKHTDITLAFGYFLEKIAGLTNFTSSDVNQCYYEAKMESSNSSQMIIQNIKRGFMMASKKGADSKQSRFTLTHSGEAHIEKLLKKQSS